MRKYAIPQNMTLEYLLTDHLGSTSVTTDSNGEKVSEMRYCEASLWDKPFGEVRYAWTNAKTQPSYALMKYTFTGQYSYTDDPSTPASEGFGLMFYVSRFYDPSLGRFTQADTLVPGGAQGLDRYAYVNNNPIRFNDPSGHKACDGEGSSGSCDQSGIPGTLSQITRALKEFGVRLSGKWSEENAYAVYLAAVIVDGKFANKFQAVFDHGVNIVWDSQCNGCRPGTIFAQNQQGKWVDTGKECGSDYISQGCIPVGGFTAGTTITFASMSGQMDYDLSRMVKNVVHELGHVYYHSVLRGPNLGNSFSRDALRPNSPAGRLDWQQHPNADGGELFADTFIAWTYDAWNTDTDPLIVDAVDSARNAMDSFVPNP